MYGVMPPTTEELGERQEEEREEERETDQSCSKGKQVEKDKPDRAKRVMQGRESPGGMV